MKVIIDEERLRANCRNFSGNMDYGRQILPIVEEVETMTVKQRLGDPLYLHILSYLDGGGEDDSLSMLLAGGRYTDRNGVERVFAGLYKAIAYYVYARMLRNPNGFLSATGFRQPTDSYSTYAEVKERESALLAVMQAADTYMADCIRYIMDDKVLCGIYRKRCPERAAGNGTTRNTYIVGE